MFIYNYFFYLYYIIIFVFGTFFGSFLNLVSDRIINGKKIVIDRSECDYCKNKLKFKNLIPLLSYIYQKGKCSYCGKKLSFYYPLSEILSGLLFVYALYLSNIISLEGIKLGVINTFGFITLLVIFSFYLIIFLTDIKYLLIPNKIIFPAIYFVLISLIISQTYSLISIYNKLSNDSFGVYLIKSGYFNDQVLNMINSFGNTIISSVSIALFFLFLVWITKERGMGGGDIKLGFLIGLVNGFPYNIVAVFLGFLIGALYSVVLIIMKKTNIKGTIPFGPFLIIGSLICLAYGSNILSWYLGLV